MVAGKFIKERYRETVVKTLGFASFTLGAGSVFSNMLVANIAAVDGEMFVSLNTQGSMMMVISLALGAVIGELLNIDGGLERFGSWLRDKTGSSKDKKFIEAFVTASITVAVGAMAIMGSIEDGLHGDYSILLAKSVLDMIFIAMMTASMGKGCIFSAIPVGLLQGTVTLFARFIEPVMTDVATSNLSLVGGVLIMAVGVNLVFPKTIRVANLLPAILFAVGFAFI